MKYIWTEEDIICGRFVCKPIKDGKVEGWQAKWTHKIGYYGGGNKSCLIAMTDGSVSLRDESPANIADFLNENQMIPMPHNRLIETMEYLRDCYE